MAERSDSNEERALEPTERRLEKAREEGQFPQSRDLTTLIVLLALTLFVALSGPFIAKDLVALVKQGLTFGPADQWQDTLWAWFKGPALSLVTWLTLLMVPIWLVSVLAPLALVRLRPVFALKFRGDRLDPIQGLGRIFSMQTLVELGKNIVKVVVIFGVGALYLWSLATALGLLSVQDADVALRNSVAMVAQGFLFLLLPIVVVAAVDLSWQVFSFRKRMRMSHEELKQELKESEGSPEIRAKLRQRQRQMATARMMSALEKADVVLANPEHFAVALRYDAERMVAPVVVAKGVDEVALRIQELAQDFKVPVARIPPLARLMHKHLEVGEAVPAPLFEAVAKVLAWAYETREAQADKDLPELGPLPDLELAQTPAS